MNDNHLKAQTIVTIYQELGIMPFSGFESVLLVLLCNDCVDGTMRRQVTLTFFTAFCVYLNSL